MHHAQLLFSKAIDANDVSVLTRYGITERDLPTDGDRQVFRFVTSYADTNRGAAPSYAEVSAQCPDFVYTPQVGDSYEYLAREIKKHSAKVQFAELVNGKLGEKFESVGQKDIFKLFEWLQSEVETIKINTNTSSKIGTNIKTDAEAFLAEYRKRKDGESFKIWQSKFGNINEQIGGYLSGNMYTWYGRSGRGKSVFTMEEAIEAAMQGANVLVWAMEMSRFEWMARAYSSIF